MKKCMFLILALHNIYAFSAQRADAQRPARQLLTVHPHIHSQLPPEPSDTPTEDNPHTLLRFVNFDSNRPEELLAQAVFNASVSQRIAQTKVDQLCTELKKYDQELRGKNQELRNKEAE